MVSDTTHVMTTEDDVWRMAQAVVTALRLVPSVSGLTPIVDLLKAWRVYERNQQFGEWVYRVVSAHYYHREPFTKELVNATRTTTG